MVDLTRVYGMSGGWHKDSVYLSTTLAPALSLHSPRTQAPDIPAEATYPRCDSRCHARIIITKQEWTVEVTQAVPE